MNLQCQQGRAEADKAKTTVENDAAIAALEEDERKLKMQYVESKLAHEKMHALGHAKQQDLKACRLAKVTVGKEAETLKGQYDAKQYEWNRVHDEERSEAAARTLAKKLEAVEKDKENRKRRRAMTWSASRRCMSC